MHVHRHRIFPIGNARVGIDTHLDRLREVHRVGIRIGRQRILQPILRAMVDDSDARVLRCDVAEHVAHPGSHGQRVHIVDESTLLVDGKGILRARHRCRVGAILALRTRGMNGASHRTQRESHDGRVVVGDNFRIVVTQTARQHSEHRQQQSKVYESFFHTYMCTFFLLLLFQPANLIRKTEKNRLFPI